MKFRYLANVKNHFVEHLVYAKGCHSEKREDGSISEGVTLNEVKLPWEENKPISGTAYYCSMSNYCNTAAALQTQMRKFLLLIFLILLSYFSSAFSFL